MPYFSPSLPSTSKVGVPPGGVAAESSTKKPLNPPGVVTMRRRASRAVKFW